MLDFTLSTPTRLLFGRGAHREIGAAIAPYAKKVLLHYGGGSIKKSGLYDEIVASLKENGVDFVTLGGVVPNPRLSLVRQGIELCRREKVGIVLAVGGGSVIDSAKAIAAGVPYSGDAWEFFKDKKPVGQALLVATVLTIPATGSEVSGDSVISDDENERKLACGSDLLRPVVSAINPELFYTLPKNQIANGAADIMSHVFERYFTNTTHTDLTDGLCEATLRTVMKNAPILFREPQNYDAWAELGFAGTVAHNGLLGCGRQEDWACHRIEHELSAIYDVAHGAGLAALIPGWMKYVYKDNVNMFVQFAVNVMGVSGSFRDPDAIVLEAIDRLAAFFGSLGLPATLRELGIDGERFALMAQKATGAAFGGEQPLGGLKKLFWQDVVEILKLVQ